MNRALDTAVDAPAGASKPRTDQPEATVEDVLPGEAAVARAARRSLDGRARGPARVWPFLGPAFIAAVNPRIIISSNDRTLTRKQRLFEQACQGVALYRTHKTGAVTVTLRPGLPLHVQTHRPAN